MIKGLLVVDRFSESGVRFVLMCLVILGCQASYPEGKIQCEDKTDCPDDWACHTDGFCWKDPETTSSDGGTTDSSDSSAQEDGGIDANRDSQAAETGNADGETDAAGGGGADGRIDGEDGSAGDAAPTCTCAVEDDCCDGCEPTNEGQRCSSDEKSCTDDRCNSGICEHVIEADFCLIEEDCYSDGDNNPNNSCQYCDVSESTDSWQNKAEGSDCDDEEFCDGEDTCDGNGTCEHSGDPCENVGQSCFESQNRCCEIEYELRCSGDGDSHIAWFDSCEREGDIVEECDADNGVCEDATCGCSDGLSGPYCDRCVIYVSPEGDDSNAGMSWDLAKNTLQAGLEVAASNQCEVWVATGEYKPTTVIGDRTATFQLRSGVDTYGGFQGDEITRNQRDWKSNPTTLSGNIGWAENTDNSYHVVTGASDVIFDGFIVSEGNASGTDDEAYDPEDFGGGMYFEYDQPVLIRNCVFNANSSRGGGAIYGFLSSINVVNSRFTENIDAGKGGAGICCDSSVATVTNGLFDENHAGSFGSGIVILDDYGYDSDAFTLITNSTFYGGESGSDTAVSNWGETKPVITNCIITGGEWLRYDEVLVDHSNVSDGPFGEGDAQGNISLDPLMLANFHLDDESPSIGKGDSEVASYTDYDGMSRVDGVDMGVFEYEGTPSSADPLCGSPIRNTENGQDYYACTPIPVDWKAAAIYCRALDAYLAVIMDENENEFIRDLIPEASSIWIGLSDIDTESVFVWSGNRSNDYLNWDTGSSLPDGGDLEDCAAISQSDGTWTDEVCYQRRGFICEKGKGDAPD